jgi:hypothetical protein
MSYFQKSTTITLRSTTNITTEVFQDSLVLALGNIATISAVGVNQAVEKTEIPAPAPAKGESAKPVQYKTTTTYSLFVVSEKDIFTETMVRDTVATMPEFKDVTFDITITT